MTIKNLSSSLPKSTEINYLTDILNTDNSFIIDNPTLLNDYKDFTYILFELDINYSNTINSLNSNLINYSILFDNTGDKVIII